MPFIISLRGVTQAQVNNQVDNALDTAIPASPTADSINERIKTIDDNYTAARAGYLDNINNAQLANITATHITNFDALTAVRAAYLDNINNAKLLKMQMMRRATLLREMYFNDLSTIPAVFGSAITGSGNVAVSQADGLNQISINTGATSASTAYLNSDNVVSLGKGTRQMTGLTVLEFQYVLVSGATNNDNTFSFMGFGSTNTADRSTNNIIGFCWVGDALNTITDSGGTETLNDVSANVTENGTQRLRIVFDHDNDQVKFYQGDTLLSTHTTNISDNDSYYLIWNIKNDAAAAFNIAISHIDLYKLDSMNAIL